MALKSLRYQSTPNAIPSEISVHPWPSANSIRPAPIYSTGPDVFAMKSSTHEVVVVVSTVSVIFNLILIILFYFSQLKNWTSNRDYVKF